jgi:hypothetical protein
MSWPEGEEEPTVYEFTLQAILSLTLMLDDFSGSVA